MTIATFHSPTTPGDPMTTTSTPQLFRKRPVVIKAMQLLDDLAVHVAIAAWINDNGGRVTIPALDPHLVIHTLEGDMRADLGDWIIQGVKGEFYPCRGDIFAATYEPADMPRGTTWVHSCGRTAFRTDGLGPTHCSSCGEPGTWQTTVTVGGAR